MRAKTIIISAALVVSSACLLVGWHQAQFTARIRDARSHLRIERAKLEARLQKSETRLAAAGNPTAHAERSPASLTPSISQTEIQTLLAQLNVFDKDPRLQALSLKASRAQTRATYAPFYRHRHLTPAQISLFEDIVSTREEKLRDIVPAAVSLGLRIDDPAIRKFNDDARSDYHEQMKSLLGDDAYATLMDYERASRVRQLVSSIAGTVTIARAPFSSAQTERLVAIIANATPKYAQGGSADTNAVDWEIVDAQARTILSEEQFKAFTTIEAPNGGRYSAKLDGALAVAMNADLAKSP